MKVLKLLFGKAGLTSLIMAFQLVLIVIVTYYFNVYFVFFQILGSLIGLGLFFSIVNRKENPEFKMPWLIMLFLFPFFTILFYLLFAHPKMKRREVATLSEIDEKLIPYVDRHRRAAKDAATLPHQGIARYLTQTTGLYPHTHNRVTYFRSGEAFFRDLLTELERAEKYIFMEYFIIELGKMWDAIHEILRRKAQAGVEVRLLYDDVGSLTTLRSGYYKKLRKEGIACRKFNPLTPAVSGKHNNRDHRKITVIDGAIAYTGGVNLGDEYINETHRLGHWKDAAVKIEGSGADNLLALFLQLYDLTAKKASDYSSYFLSKHESYAEEGAALPFGDGPAPYYKEQIGAGNYVNMINAAERYVYISTPYLIPDHTIVTALRNAAYRGVDVRILAPCVPDKRIVFQMTRSNYPYLLDAGVKVYEYTPGFVHAKTLVADDEVAFVGTINLDYRSLVHHYECGVALIGTPCIKEIRQDMEEAFRRSALITRENFKMNRLVRMINAVLNIFSPMF